MTRESRGVESGLIPVALLVRRLDCEAPRPQPFEYAILGKELAQGDDGDTHPGPVEGDADGGCLVRHALA
jgi:hypothetical protein